MIWLIDVVQKLGLLDWIITQDTNIGIERCQKEHVAGSGKCRYCRGGWKPGLRVQAVKANG